MIINITTMRNLILVFTCVFFFGCFSFGQVDSTEIKLTHYKDLFVKGLITSQEYETMKGQLLGLPVESKQPTVAVVVNDSIRKADSLLVRKMVLQGKADAKEYYRPSGPAAGTAVTSMFLGAIPIGLIPAIACSQTKPKEENLNYPDALLFKNPDYANAYRLEARRIKSATVWIGWGGGLAANILVGTVTGIVLGNKNRK